MINRNGLKTIEPTANINAKHRIAINIDRKLVLKKREHIEVILLE